MIVAVLARVGLEAEEEAIGEAVIAGDEELAASDRTGASEVASEAGSVDEASGDELGASVSVMVGSAVANSDKTVLKDGLIFQSGAPMEWQTEVAKLAATTMSSPTQFLAQHSAIGSPKNVITQRQPGSQYGQNPTGASIQPLAQVGNLS